MKDYYKYIFHRGRYVLFGISIGSVLYNFRSHIGCFLMCTGPSMEPTLAEGHIVYCDKIFYKAHGIQPGDIVIAKSVLFPNMLICKRVAAVSGQWIFNRLAIKKVPEGHVWIQGDNSSDSSDSRTYGPIPQALLVGRVAFRLWPHFSFF